MFIGGGEGLTNYTLPEGNETIGSFTVFLIVKLYADVFASGAVMFHTENTGGGALSISHGPSLSQISVSLAQGLIFLILFLCMSCFPFVTSSSFEIGRHMSYFSYNARIFAVFFATSIKVILGLRLS